MTRAGAGRTGGSSGGNGGQRRVRRGGRFRAYPLVSIVLFSEPVPAASTDGTAGAFTEIRGTGGICGREGEGMWGGALTRTLFHLSGDIPQLQQIVRTVLSPILFLKQSRA